MQITKSISISADDLYKIFIIVAAAVVTWPKIHKAIFVTPVETKEVIKRGKYTIGIEKFKKDDAIGELERTLTHIKSASIWYSYYVDGVEKKCYVSDIDIPRGYILPDTTDVFYLPEDPNINRTAFMIFSEYNYTYHDEKDHKARPVFDTINRKYIYK